jgi:hypothetical protein
MRRESLVRPSPWGIAATLLLAPAPAAGAAGVTWEAPDPCPGQEQVRALVASWLGQSARELDLKSVRVTARVQAGPAGFTLDLTVESSAGSERQQLAAAECETLAKIVALKVALAVDPLTALDVAEPQPTSAPRRLRAPEPERRLQGAVRAAGGAAFGPLPGITSTVALVGALRWPDFRVELGLAYWFPRSVTYDELPSVGADLQMVGAMARACPTGRLAGVEILLCAGAEAGVMRGNGFGIANSRTDDRGWVALSVGPVLAIPLLDALYLWLEADAAFGLIRPSFRIQNLPRLYEADEGAAQASAGLELRNL